MGDKDQPTKIDQSINAKGSTNTKITQHNNNFFDNSFKIDVSPQVELERVKKAVQKRGTTYTFQIKITHPGSRIYVAAKGDFVALEIDRPAIGGMVSMTKTELQRGSLPDGSGVFEAFANPAGSYLLSVTTKGANEPSISIEVEP